MSCTPTCPACGQTITKASYDLAKFEYERVNRIPAGVRTDWENMFIHALALLIAEFEEDALVKAQAILAQLPSVPPVQAAENLESAK